MNELRKIKVCSKHQSKYKAALRLRHKEKLSGAEIARRLGLKTRTVCLWLQRPKTNDAVQVRAKHLAKYHEALKLRRESGGILSGAHIARILELNPRTVRYWFQKEKLEANNA